jgi:hypothetical protein
MDRHSCYTIFMNERHSGPRPSHASAQDIARIECELRTRLPLSFVQFLRLCGGAYTPALLDTIVSAGLANHDLANIFTPDELIRLTRLYWSGGMSTDLIGFAVDSLGNVFCFERVWSDTPRPDDLPVWFFDHDVVSAEVIFQSYDQWLMSYVRLTPTKDRNA